MDKEIPGKCVSEIEHLEEKESRKVYSGLQVV